ncbi:MAG: methyltransferase domain-containing protein [Candidatus Jordarchaeaceae archaeon]
MKQIIGTASNRVFFPRTKSVLGLVKFFYLLRIRGTFQFIMPHAIKFVNKTYTLPEFALLREFIEGRYGLEIGGPTPMFRYTGLLPLYPLVSGIDNCIYSKETVWSQFKFGSEDGSTFRNIIISEASDLSSIRDKKYDFVISSHMIEHLSNPVKAVFEMKRVTRNEGAIIIIAPHKDITFDHNRRVTSLEHMILDLNNNVKEGSIDHLDLDEIYRTYDFELDSGIRDVNEFRERTLRNMENRALHQHVFDTETILKIYDYVQIKIVFVHTSPIYSIMVIGQKSENYSTFEQSHNRVITGNVNWRKFSLFSTDKK